MSPVFFRWNAKLGNQHLCCVIHLGKKTFFFTSADDSIEIFFFSIEIFFVWFLLCNHCKLHCSRIFLISQFFDRQRNHGSWNSQFIQFPKASVIQTMRPWWNRFTTDFIGTDWRSLRPLQPLYVHIAVTNRSPLVCKESLSFSKQNWLPYSLKPICDENKTASRPLRDYLNLCVTRSVAASLLCMLDLALWPIRALWRLQ